ncbi:MAG: glycerophosphodiester phosphodiesterase [Clostridium sp.]|nr:glycerophosphodiester phosphodiesterase [Clostridium sp.]
MKKERFLGMLKALFHYNFRTLFFFEVFFKLAAYGLFTPLFLRLVEFSIGKAGLHYLSAAAMGRFFASPWTWAVLVLIMVLVACYVVADVTVVTICVDCSRRGEYVSGHTLLWEALKAVGRMFYWRNLPILPLSLVLLPVLSFSFLTGYVTSIRLPEFMENLLFGFLRQYWVLLLFLVLVLVAAFRFIYGIFYYILEKKNCVEACKSSHYLIYRAYFQDFLRLLIWQVVSYFAYLAIVALLILFIIGVSSLLREREFIHAVMISAIDWMMGIVAVLFSCAIVPLSTIFLSHMFYRNKALIGEPVQTVFVKTRESSLSAKEKRIVLLIAVLALVLVNVRNVQHFTDGAFSDAAEIAHRTEVTAHRGYSSGYPENTMPAFLAAMDAGADWIELDVQQTADGEVVVMHDSNFKRTAGVDRNVWDMAYREVAELDVGSFCAPEFAGTHVSTLAEVLEECGGRIKLNIEIKPTGHETDLVERVVSLVREYDVVEDCVVASMSYSVLEEVKALDEEVQTVYVMQSAYGNFADLKDADHFSVRYNYVTDSMVDTVHAQGKELYAWTINTQKLMEQVLSRGVDNLITDQPETARRVVFETESSTVLNRYIKMLTDWFQLQPR